jgi:hypothetical protein
MKYVVTRVGLVLSSRIEPVHVHTTQLSIKEVETEYDCRAHFFSFPYDTREFGVGNVRARGREPLQSDGLFSCLKKKKRFVFEAPLTSVDRQAACIR